jgi:osmoprotectant transport system ATP-binding protein
MIEFRNVSKSFGTVVSVAGINLTVERGELLVLLGGSGSGKTTCLKMVNRLIEPDAGDVIVAGRNVRSMAPHLLRRSIGYCFQRIGLFPHMTVGQNIGITPTLLGWPKSRIASRVAELLELVALPAAEYRDRLPGQLSGGQQQRVGVARALAAQPDVVLFDEPFGALDPLTRDRLQHSLGEIRRQVQMTAIFVTHDMVEALLLADRIAVMHNGKLLQVGTPQALLSAPANDYVAQLLETPTRQSEKVHSLFARVMGPDWRP